MKMEYPAEMKWVIKAKNLNKKGTIGKINETTIPDVCYNLVIFCPSRSPVIYLMCVIRKNDDQAIEAELTATIPSANKTFQMGRYANVSTKNKVVYFTTIATKTDVMNAENHYIADGNLTIYFKGIIKKDNLKGKYPFEETSLGCIMWNKSAKDFTFVIGDSTIKVHKFVMAERSGYFEAMFNAAWKENEENQTTVEKFAYAIVEKAVKCCYDFPLIIDSAEEAKSLLEFSDYYDIKNLKHEAECYLTEKISVENVCDFANASVKASSTVLRLCCINFLVKCLKDSTAVDGIEGLDADFNKQLLKHAFCTTQKL